MPEPRTMPVLFGFEGALGDPAVLLLLGVMGGLLVVAGVVIGVLAARGRLAPAMRSELLKRTAAWGVMVPLVTVPILFGRGATVGLVTLLSLLCYREFARATGMFRDKVMTVLVAASIVGFNFAALDHWQNLWEAMAPMSLVVMAVAAIARDEPKGFIQRVGLATFCVLLFGACLSHLSLLTVEPGYRAPMLLMLIAIGLNDVFAFCVGKAVKGPKLAPVTSPGKTISGAVGAIVLTTAMVVGLGSRVFVSELAEVRHLVVMGLLVSIAGILGDLTVSSVKRDVGIKDMGVLIPGHGGVLDRCNSLLLAAPVLYHYVSLFHGVGIGQPARVFTGQP